MTTDGRGFVRIEPSGEEVLVKRDRVPERVGAVVIEADGIETVLQTAVIPVYVEGLPSAVPGTALIVNMPVRAALPHRPDLFCVSGGVLQSEAVYEVS